MASYASAGVGGTGLGLGIAGTAAGVPALIMSIIALVREGREHHAGRMAAANGLDINAINTLVCDKSAIAKLEAERYTDIALMASYKEAACHNEKVCDKLALLDKNEAIDAVRIECLRGQFDKLEAKVEKMAEFECKLNGDLIHVNDSVRALAVDTKSAIELEAERRKCGDENIYNYMHGHYIPGTLRLSPNDMCPSPKHD